MADQKIRLVASDQADCLALLSSIVHVVFATAVGNRQGVGNDPVYTHSGCFDPFPFPDLSGKPALKARLDELGERLDSFRKERLAEHDFLTMTKLYNVLERVRALEAAAAGFPPPLAGEGDREAVEGASSSGDPPSVAFGDTSPESGGGKEVGAQSRDLDQDEAPDSHEGPGSAAPSGNSSPARAGEAVEPLTETERDIYEAGLVGVLKDIHDQIDAAVFDAYGWPAGLSEEEILERLVALNHERAAEEARGHVRWLRPEFQNPTGQAARKAEQSEIVLPEAAKAAAGIALPKDDADRARAVRTVLTASPQPLSSEEVAAAFSGKNTQAKIGKVAAMLSILEAVGQAEATDDQRWFAGG